jgi:hypothetical protein
MSHPRKTAKSTVRVQEELTLDIISDKIFHLLSEPLDPVTATPLASRTSPAAIPERKFKEDNA